ncbi:DUF2207 domain-containing protein [Virgibacillus chiguensis]|uniref:Uncharacterized membrane protein n=1 Tax=Virgibacillus chiguensis TaxID=411959 RepID=A0A1M5QQQ6_9BACI|nr:DUF2207 domain-containing protein [Virgibacillus chiguensis]SHH16286.1 Uncharacterized membrane protein [Virgibacillus chiguensis]
MQKKLGLVFGIILFLCLIPNTVFAVDFSINQSNVDAYLQKDGEVHVNEQHTYQFDGEFNGMTRTLIPSENASIHNVTATEAGEDLKVKQEENVYKIYRSGKNETVTIQLSYIIKNGLQAYSDLVVFSWSFFDSESETDYEQFDAFIHPPQKTENSVAYGEDEAFKTEKQKEDGTIHFAMGYVDSYENGAITVGYDRSLFPKVPLTEEKPIREELLATKQALLDKEQAFLNRKSTLKEISPYAISIFSFLSLFLLFVAWRKKQVRELELARLSESVHFLPKQEMSLPATVAYMKHGKVGSTVMTAALLDLERKGFIQRDNDDLHKFTVIHEQTDHEHEKILIDLLFYTVGNNGVFCTNDVKAFTENTANQDIYQKELYRYYYTVKKEIKEHHLVDKKTGTRITAGVLSFLIAPFIIVFAIHELYASTAMTGFLFVFLALFAILYRPRTLKGARIYKQWKEFEEKNIQPESTFVEHLTDDEQKRGLIYGVGVNRTPIHTKWTTSNKQLLHHSTSGEGSSDDYTDVMMLILATTAINTQFHNAQATVTADTTSASIGAGSGTGAGGSGGGSGAF